MRLFINPFDVVPYNPIVTSKNVHSPQTIQSQYVPYETQVLDTPQVHVTNHIIHMGLLYYYN